MRLGNSARRLLARPIAALLGLTLLAAAPAPARLPVAPQMPAAAKGSLTGDQVADYLITGTAGHTLDIRMTTSSRSAHFNLTLPGSDTALFIGSIDGLRFKGKLPESGDYRLRVYLNRGAARRNEKADFSLRAWVLPTR